MPRSHGKFGEPRSYDYPQRAPHIPPRLAARQAAFDEIKAGQVPTEYHRPGSQNPRKR